MTQEEFNEMLQAAIAQGIGGGTYTSVYSGEEIDTLLGMTSYAAGDQVIADITTTVTDAQEAAEAAQAGAEAAQQAIEDMTVSASTLAPGSSATVTKTESGGVVNLDFGLPRGAKGDKGDTGAAGPAGPNTVLNNSTGTNINGALVGDGSVVAERAIAASPSSGSGSLITSGGVADAIAPLAQNRGTLTPSSDPDALKQPGFWRWAAANKPAALPGDGGAGALEFIGANNATATSLQRLTYSNGQTYTRWLTTSGWGSWHELGQLDATLTIENAAADAKATGDAIALTYQNRGSVTPSTDPDTLKQQGFWRWAAANKPSALPEGGDSGALEFIGANNATTNSLQRLTYSNGKVFVRWLTTSGWGNWRRMPDAGEVDTLSAEIDRIDRYNYLDALSLDRTGSDRTSNGVTYTLGADGSWTINGTATGGDSFCNIISSNAQLPKHVYNGREYYLNTHGESVRVRVYFTINGAATLFGSYTKNATIRVPADATGMTVRWQINVGESVNNKTLRYTLTALPPDAPFVNYNGTRVVLIGDSIVAGRLGDQPAGSGVRPAYTFDQRISAELNIPCDNLAVGGMGWISTANHSENAMDYIDRIMASLAPYTLLWLEFGGNDSAAELGTYEDAPATREEAVTIMGAVYYTLTQIFNTYPTVQVVLAAPVLGKPEGTTFPNWGYLSQRGPSGARWTMKDLNEQYDRFSEKYHVPVVHLDKALNSWHLRGTAMMGDNVHPVDAGYEVLTRYVVGQLRTLI